MFGQKVIDDAKIHAVKAYPNESVGYVAGDVYYPQINIAESPEKEFRVDPQMWVKVGLRGGMQAVIHSHPVGLGESPQDYPSRVDMERQIDSNVPWGILTCDSERASDPIWFGDGTPKPPLIGEKRIFRHGVTDCYSLIRDYYDWELDIKLKDFPREWGWWRGADVGKHANLYEECFAETGFRRVSHRDALPNDLFLAYLPKIDTICHGGIYLGGVGEMILHHVCNNKPVDAMQIARKQPGVHYLQYVAYFLRHEVMDERYKAAR